MPRYIKGAIKMAASRKKRNKQKATPPVEHVTIQEAEEITTPEQPEEIATPEQPEETTTEKPEDFIKSSHRKQSVRHNTMKRLRFIDEIEFVNKFTEMYITNAIPKEDIKILADVKAFLLQKEGNPYNLKAGEANAMICSDLKHLCIDGEIVGDDRVKLEAKEVSANRVTYFNSVLAQQLIRDAPDDETKEAYKERFDTINGLLPRTGYGHS